MRNVQEEINQVWQIEQEILDVVHGVCCTHNLRYTLAYGTLLGAVRHGGFIPWDDDIDLMMPREDYEKFLIIWNTVSPKGYILQNIGTDSDYTNTFTKIRKDHTTFLQEEAEAQKHYHKGVFVDIFPVDRVADGIISNALQYVACAVNLLYTREYFSGTGGIVGLVEHILLALPQGLHSFLRKTAEKYIQKWNGSSNLKWFSPCTIKCAKRYYPSDLFENIKRIPFRTKTYFCVSNPDTVLKIDYGDYMQLPPEEERVWKHHPILIDFNRNYEEIVASQIFSKPI